MSANEAPLVRTGGVGSSARVPAAPVEWPASCSLLPAMRYSFITEWPVLAVGEPSGVEVSCHAAPRAHGATLSAAAAPGPSRAERFGVSQPAEPAARVEPPSMPPATVPPFPPGTDPFQALMVAAACGWIPPSSSPARETAPPHTLPPPPPVVARDHHLFMVFSMSVMAFMATTLFFMVAGNRPQISAAQSTQAPLAMAPPGALAAPLAAPTAPLSADAVAARTTAAVSEDDRQAAVTATASAVAARSATRGGGAIKGPAAAGPVTVAAEPVADEPEDDTAEAPATLSRKLDDAARSAEMLRQQLANAAN